MRVSQIVSWFCPNRLIFAELKSEKGKVRPKQEEWLESLYEGELRAICLASLRR